MEQIGNVILDETLYHGQDNYSDGEVEDVILDIVKNNTRDKYDDIITERRNWPILYHLSDKRTNIIEWFPIGKDKKVLEIGSGCGAITGVLADKAGTVTCIEL